MLVVLVVLSLGIWAVSLLPLDAVVRRIIQAVLIVLAIFWILDGFGLLTIVHVEPRR